MSINRTATCTFRRDMCAAFEKTKPGSTIGRVDFWSTQEAGIYSTEIRLGALFALGSTGWVSHHWSLPSIFSRTTCSDHCGKHVYMKLVWHTYSGYKFILYRPNWVMQVDKKGCLPAYNNNFGHWIQLAKFSLPQTSPALAANSPSPFSANLAF